MLVPASSWPPRISRTRLRQRSVIPTVQVADSFVISPFCWAVLSLSAAAEARMTVAVRTDLTAAEAREQAKAATTPDQARRLLAVALVLEGAGREEAARGTGMDRQTPRSIAARSTGPSLQRGWAGGSGRPQGSRTVAPLDPTPARRAARLPGGGSRSRPRRRGPLAPGRSLRPVSCADIPPGDRPAADGRAALRRPLPRAMNSGAVHGQARPGARLQPDPGPAAAPPIRSRGASRVQKNCPT